MRANRPHSILHKQVQVKNSFKYVLLITVMLQVLMIPRRSNIKFEMKVSWENLTLQSFKPSNKYENQWYQYGYREISDYKSDVSTHCTLCNFSSRNHRSNSSPTDVVMVTMLNMTYNILPFTRSLRTTGSKASIVFFIDNTAEGKLKSSKLMNFMTECGCTFINIGTVEKSRNTLLLLRNGVCFDFLQTRPTLFKRVLIVDLFDTVFQGDPFHDQFDESTVGMSLETQKCDPGQRRGAKNLIGKQADDMKKRKCINVGTIIGPTHLVIKFLGFYIDYVNNIDPETLAKIVWIPDQVIINSLIVANITQKAGIPIRLYENTEDYIVMMNLFRAKLDFALGRLQVNKSFGYPLVIHLFDRIQKFCDSVQTLCPKLFDQPDPYIRCTPTLR